MYNFDGRNVDLDAGAATPLPNGDYLVVVEDWVVKESKAGNQYLELVLNVENGPHEGWKVWVKFNLWNSNPEAVDIARGELARLCVHGIGMEPVFQTPDELLGKRFIATTKQREHNGTTYVDVKKYSKFESRQTNQAPQSNVPTSRMGSKSSRVPF